MNTTHRLNSSTPDAAPSSRAKAAPAGRIERTLRRVNYTHSGLILSVAGFTWLLAAGMVLIVRTPLNVWAGFLAVVASAMVAGRIRGRLREHRAAFKRQRLTARLRVTTASE